MRSELTVSDPASLRLLLQVWRQVGQHLEIASSLDAILPLVRGRAPVDALGVLRWVPEESKLVPVALCPWSEAHAPLRLGPEAVARFEAWLDAKQAGPLSGALREDLDPRPRHGAVEAAPLSDAAGPAGVLLAWSDAPRPDRATLLQALAEPLTVALRNDHRLAELARLREATEAENRALLSRLQRDELGHTVVGADAGLRGVMTQVQQVAPTDAPVLILGETGAGKEVISRAIHAQSRRRDGPFLRVNCGAIPPELIDSELFGHEKGSFTGAVSTRRGWFERADGGTLFLDELGELPAAAQVRLLRVLQDGSYERVGGQRSLTADVRIIAATHRDMRALVAEGRFREDLWYRISVFPLTLPPLRERADDIDRLAAHFAERAGLRLHGVPLAPTPSDLARLRAYAWPGNVRELASVIERASILGNGTRLALEAALGNSGPTPTLRAASVASTHGSLAAINRAAIEAALTASRGRVEGARGAAAALGVRPSTLRSRMSKLGVEAERFRD